MGWFELAFVARRPWLWPGLVRAYAGVAASAPTLRSVELGVTYACPMSCGYCSATELMRERREPLDIAAWKRVIAQAVDLGAVHFLLTGGEPLLTPLTEELLREVRRTGRVGSIVTTGFGLDAARARSLAAAGLQAAEISLDGASSDIHDTARHREGAFAAAMGAASALERVDIRVLFTHVVTRETLRSGETERVAALAARRGAQLNLGFVGLAGRAAADGVPLLRPQDWERVDEMLSRPSIRSCSRSSWRGDSCTAGSEKIYITRHGDVAPCPLLPSLRFGSVTDEPLGAIWRRMTAIPELSAGQPRCLPAADPGFIQRMSQPAVPALEGAFPAERLLGHGPELGLHGPERLPLEDSGDR